MASSTTAQQPPTSFPFPFVPYDIQTKFMRQLYSTLEQGKIGIFESPTGTGKSLSLICGSLKWLTDYNKREEERRERLMTGSVTETATTTSEATCGRTVPDWFIQYDKDKQIKDEINAIKRLAERKRKREERVKKMKEQYGHSLGHSKLKQSTSDTLTVDQLVEDEDIVLDEYHSDTEPRPLTSDSDSDCSDCEDEPLKIFYASRTHSQLSQFIHEIQRTQYAGAVGVVPLGSRGNYCINERVKGLKSIGLINDKCIELRRNKATTRKGSGCGQQRKRRKSHDNSGCPFSKPTSIEILRDLTLGGVQDIEHIVTAGKRLGACPYYATRHAVPHGQVIVLPYNCLLHSDTRKALGINVKGNIVIIDEAHNLLDTIASIHSVTVYYSQLSKCLCQLEQYKERYCKRLKAKNLLYINQLIGILRGFLKLLAAGEEEEVGVVMRLNEFLLKSNTDNINLFKLLNYCNKSGIAQKLNGFAARYCEGVGGATVTKKEATPILYEATPTSPLLLIEQLLGALTEQDTDCRVVVKRGVASQACIKYLLLNPSTQFTSIVREARSVILAGGTMEPISEFRDQLFVDVSDERIERFSCGHVIEGDRLLPITLSKGPSGCEFDFTYHKRNDLNMIDELGRTVANVCTICPGGVVCFFPSYEYEKRVYTRWAESGQLTVIGKRKQVFREPKLSSQVEQVLSQYGDCIKGSNASGAVMFCIVGGKLSEGINFSDDLGRCIIMVGLPFPNLKSPELMEKMSYLDKHHGNQGAVAGKSPGQVHYENLCMKAVNQSIGRAIRHSCDYASIVLVDRRYASETIRTKLPGWIGSQLLVASGFGHMFGAMRKFFTSKKTETDDRMLQ